MIDGFLFTLGAIVALVAVFIACVFWRATLWLVVLAAGLSVIVGTVAVMAGYYP